MAEQLPPAAPSLIPEAGFVISDDASFTQDALALLQFTLPKARVINSILVEDLRWGKVWRADFELPGQDQLIGQTLTVNRVVCWRREDGISAISIAPFSFIPPL